ncbi:MAG: hypothetical protein RBU45_22105 [Myxococcota bacterium]|nr:hypothetical protein [Myxococcota bacterium]
MRTPSLLLFAFGLLWAATATAQEAWPPDPGAVQASANAEVVAADEAEEGEFHDGEEVYEEVEEEYAPPASQAQPRSAGSWQSYAPAPATPAAPPAAPDEAGEPIDEGTWRQTLDPYGHWEVIPPYGAVWIPSTAVVGADFRPYTRGRWVYTAHGWTWVSSYSWGWVPFHYGRWHVIGSRWAWIPGREWAPAWVTWRSDDEVVGWAPLPWGVAVGATIDVGPYGWSFVPVGYLGAPILSPYYIPGHRVVYYYGRTRPLFYTHRHHRYGWGWYGGPRRDWVASRWGRPVPLARYRHPVSHPRAYAPGHRPGYAPARRPGYAPGHRPGYAPARRPAYAPGHRPAPGPAVRHGAPPPRRDAYRSSAPARGHYRATRPGGPPPPAASPGSPPPGSRRHVTPPRRSAGPPAGAPGGGPGSGGGRGERGGRGGGRR